MSSFNGMMMENTERSTDSFVQKVDFKIQEGDFEIKTAKTPEDLKMALQLRHKIFIQEGLGQDSGDDGALDFDEFDLQADHIIVVNTVTQQPVGTYRVLSSDFCSSFYSGREFDLSEFFAVPGTKLELGRACIDKEFRKSIAIHLVWKGLGRYSSLIEAKYMFGCTSLKIRNKNQADQIVDYLKPDFHSDRFNIKPTGEYANYESYHEMRFADRTEIKRIIPPLMKSYMKAGAKFFGEPAYDAKMETTDFFTICDLTELNEQYERRYRQL